MTEEKPGTVDTVALETKLEEDFVSPLTAVRGALEILRDHPELSTDERGRFLTTALAGVARLERGIEHLGETVYAAARGGQTPAALPHEERVHLIPAEGIVEIDLSDFAFTNSQVVNEVFDAIEARLRPTGHRWHCLVNFARCSIWPEAWVTYAHRAKRVLVNMAHDTVRYADPETHASDPSIHPSREAALAAIRSRTKRAG